MEPVDTVLSISNMRQIDLVTPAWLKIWEKSIWNW